MTTAEEFWDMKPTNEGRVWHPLGHLTERGLHITDHINPQYYKTDSLEAIDVIEAFFMHSPHLANVFKYIARAGEKDDEIQDLEKAQWYLSRYIDYIKENDNQGRVEARSRV